MHHLQRGIKWTARNLRCMRPITVYKCAGSATAKAQCAERRNHAARTPEPGNGTDRDSARGSIYSQISSISERKVRERERELHHGISAHKGKIPSLKLQEKKIHAHANILYRHTGRTHGKNTREEHEEMTGSTPKKCNFSIGESRTVKIHLDTYPSKIAIFAAALFVKDVSMVPLWKKSPRALNGGQC